MPTRTIITGQKLDYNRHSRYQFAEYVQTHEQHNNLMNPRMVGALALHPTGNVQGSYYFMSISTAWVLNWLHTTALPMLDEVVDRIHRLAQQQRVNPGLLFGDRNMNSVERESEDPSDDEDDEDYIPDQEEHDEESNVEDDDTIRNYNDDNNDYESVGNISIHINEENNVDEPTGTPGEAVTDENLGVEDNEIKGEEQEGQDFVGSEVEDSENP